MIMAEDLDDSISVRVLFDKEKNQVICVEAGSDFVDILFSFLTLPMGTIVRLMQKQKNSESPPIGCFSNLYQSVSDFSLDNFNTDLCKDMLMYPKSPLEIFYKDLKVKFDGAPVNYFLCADVTCPEKMLSYYKNGKCSCGKLLNREVSESTSSSTINGEGDIVEELNLRKERVEVFVKRSMPYIVTDNMKVMPCTPGALLELLRGQGMDNVNLVGEKDFKMGPEEILNLLVHTLKSKTPLTDLFLSNQKSISDCKPGEERDHQVSSNGTSTRFPSNSVEIKIFVSKSNKKLLYAEAMEDFVELLFSFLTFPLSNVVRCLAGDSPFDCVNNLYKSVEGLGDKCFVDKFGVGTSRGRSFSKKLLVNPGLTPNFNSLIEKFKLCKVRDREIYQMTINGKGDLCAVMYRPDEYYDDPDYYYSDSGDQNCEILMIANPKARQGKYSNVGFVKTPTMFIISDTLVIKPSNVSFLKDLGVPFDGIEEYKIRLGKQEVLSILKASLTTSSAFSPILDILSKKRKRDSSEITLN